MGLSVLSVAGILKTTLALVYKRIGGEGSQFDKILNVYSTGIDLSNKIQNCGISS